MRKKRCGQRADTSVRKRRAMRKIVWHLAWWWRYTLKEGGAILGYTPRPPRGKDWGEYPSDFLVRLKEEIPVYGIRAR
jgi:hypothetical protein